VSNYIHLLSHNITQYQTMSFETMSLMTETIGDSEHCICMTEHESMPAEVSKIIEISGLELLTASCNDQVEQDAEVESHDSFESYDSFAVESYSKDLRFSQLDGDFYLNRETLNEDANDSVKYCRNLDKTLYKKDSSRRLDRKRKDPTEDFQLRWTDDQSNRCSTFLSHSSILFEDAKDSVHYSRNLDKSLYKKGSSRLLGPLCAND
jgi:hypothetical protein